MAEALPEAAVLVQELENFQVKLSELGHDSYGTWRENQHDDLVLAVALACWYRQWWCRHIDEAFAANERMPA